MHPSLRPWGPETPGRWEPGADPIRKPHPGGPGSAVLAVAQREETAAPKQFDAQTLEHDLTFVGLIGMMDPPPARSQDGGGPLRGGGHPAIMITGDHKETAVAIAAS